MGNFYSYLGGNASEATSSESWGKTKMEMKPYYFTWTINQFPLWLNQVANAVERSPTFSTGEHKWCLQLHSKNSNWYDQSFLSMYLILFESPHSKVLAQANLGIVNADGKRISCFKTYQNNFKEGGGWGADLFILKSSLLNNWYHRYLSSTESVTFFCEVNVYSISPASGTSPSVKVTLPASHLTSLPSFLQSGNFSDVTLAVGGKEFPAHKLILASASPVFAAMLQHNMKEKLESRVEIEDVDLPVFEEFLHFIYAEKVDNLEENAQPLLILAERYAVQRLKATCEDFLASQLTLENVVDLHCLARLHNANQLKAITSEFLKKHSAKISKSSKFQSLIKANPHPLIDVVHLMHAEN